MSEPERLRMLPTFDRGPSEELAEEATERFRTDDSFPALRPIQAYMLDELARVGGLVANVGVGHGKTLVGLLAGHMVDADRAAYFLPANTKYSVVQEAKKWSKGYDLCLDIELVTYTKLSRKGTRAVLQEIQPDFIVLDEAHKLRNKTAARTKRFSRYMQQCPNTRVMAMSGTLTSRSLKDYSHIVKWALKKYSPVPVTKTAKRSLASITDDLSEHRYAETWEWQKWKQFIDKFSERDGDQLLSMPTKERREAARGALRERLKESAGVVITSKSSAAASIRVSPVDIEIPETIETALKDARKKFVLPNGEFIDSATSVAATQRQLSVGFYYEWDWPNGKDREWLYARREWNQAVRKAIRYGRKDLDSPAVVRDAVKSGDYTNEDVVEAWEQWKPHKDKPEPDTKPVWVDTGLLRKIVERSLARYDKPLIWYRWQATAEKLNELFPSELAVCHAGGQSPEALDGTKPLAVSQASHRKGLNLQHYHENVILNPSPSAQTWEQLAGRTHRAGQPADTVYFDAMAHIGLHRKALVKAKKNARYIEQTQGQNQKLLLADWTGEVGT